MARTEDRWWSLTSVPDAVWSVASVPAAAGHVSLGAAVLVGQSMTQVLRAASRALDHVAATTGEVRILDRLLRRRTAGSEPDALLGTDIDHVSGEVGGHLASESQWIAWLDHHDAAEWADFAVQVDWARLRASASGHGHGEEPLPASLETRIPSVADPLGLAESSRKTRNISCHRLRKASTKQRRDLSQKSRS